MEPARVFLLIILLIFFFATPEIRPPTPSQREEISRRLEEDKHATEVLAQSQYGDLDINKWLNITGFRDVDGYGWDRFLEVKQRAEAITEAAIGQRYWSFYKASDQEHVHSDSEWREEEGSLNEKQVPRGVEEIDSQQAEEEISLDNPLPLYRNVTGIVHGEWMRTMLSSPYSPPQINFTSLNHDDIYVSEVFDRNITGATGKVQIRLNEKKGTTLINEEGTVREIAAQLSISDDTSYGDGWKVALYGVHFTDFGGMILVSTSDKFAGIFGLPQFSLSQETFSLSQNLLNETIRNAITAEESNVFQAPSYPWTSTVDTLAGLSSSVSHCEYIVWLQQHRSPSLNSQLLGSKDLSKIENELRHPNGASIPPPPPMRMSMLAFSPDCGFVLESKGPPDLPPRHDSHLVGPKVEIHVRETRKVALIAASISVFQVLLMMRQMKDASTPSTIGRISLYTIAIMTMSDGFMLLVLLFVGIAYDAASVSLFAVSFFSAFGFFRLGLKLLLDIWTIQAPERRDRERATAQNNGQDSLNGSTPAIVVTPAGADLLPLPASAHPVNNSQPTQVILPPDQDLDPNELDTGTTENNTNRVNNPTRELSDFLSRFIFLFLSLIFLTLNSLSWPPRLRTIYIDGLAFVYVSLWIPQIYRNVLRNCLKALRWDFVLGQSFLRFTPILYFYCVPNNVLFVETDTNTALILASWLWFQILLLASQSIIGPRFFIKAAWAPEAYDYHPILRVGNDEENSTGNLPVGFSIATGAEDAEPFGSESGGAGGRGRGGGAGTKQARVRVYDCAICMQAFEVPVVTTDSDGVESDGLKGGLDFLARRAYMVCPCRHVFHSACLEGWMKYRLQCPICREGLPPL